MDRLPPFSQDAEMAVIGCCLSDPAICLPESQQVLTVNYFYDERCQIVWELFGVMELREVNFITVSQKLKDSKKMESESVYEFLNHCQDLAVSTANLPAWLDELTSKFILRGIIRTCGELSQMVYNGTDGATQCLDAAEKKMLAIRPCSQQNDGIKKLVRSAIDRIELKFNNGEKITGISTGLQDLDKISDGLHGGELIVIAGQPSTGKTALACNIAFLNASQKIPCSIHSAEMRPVQLTVRALCSGSRANYHFLTESALASISNVCAKIANSPIHIESAHGQTAGQVCASARRLFQKHGIKIMVVDYIQLLTGVGDNREQQVSSISKSLKAIALELDITVLALSQLNDDGRMRESRAIAQDADSIWKLENDGDWHPKIQPVKLRIEKCRDGETGIVNLTFLKEFTLFQNSEKVDREDSKYKTHND